MLFVLSILCIACVFFQGNCNYPPESQWASGSHVGGNVNVHISRPLCGAYASYKPNYNAVNLEYCLDSNLKPDNWNSGTHPHYRGSRTREGSPGESFNHPPNSRTNLISNPYCICNPGYVLKSRSNKVCISRFECPHLNSNVKKCGGVNQEYYTKCTTTQESCSDINPTPRYYNNYHINQRRTESNVGHCKIGCFCKKGYVYRSSSDKTCVLKSQCQQINRIPKCPSNLTWKTCNLPQFCPTNNVQPPPFNNNPKPPPISHFQILPKIHPKSPPIYQHPISDREPIVEPIPNPAYKNRNRPTYRPPSPPRQTSPGWNTNYNRNPNVNRIADPGFSRHCTPGCGCPIGYVYRSNSDRTCVLRSQCQQIIRLPSCPPGLIWRTCNQYQFCPTINDYSPPIANNPKPPPIYHYPISDREPIVEPIPNPAYQNRNSPTYRPPSPPRQTSPGWNTNYNRNPNVNRIADPGFSPSCFTGCSCPFGYVYRSNSDRTCILRTNCMNLNTKRSIQQALNKFRDTLYKIYEPEPAYHPYPQYVNRPGVVIPN